MSEDSDTYHVVVETQTIEEYDLCLRGIQSDGNYFGDGQTWECIAPLRESIPALPPTVTETTTTTGPSNGGPSITPSHYESDHMSGMAMFLMMLMHLLFKIVAAH